MTHETNDTADPTEDSTHPRTTPNDAAFEQLKSELRTAFAAPEDRYHPLTAAEVIARNRE